MPKIFFLFYLLCFFLFSMHIYANEYVIQKNDTLWSISKKFNQKPELIIRLNRIKNNKLITGSKIFIPEKIINYTIEKGDNLSKIAREKGSTIDLIFLANDINKSEIFPGKSIKIPAIEKNQKENMIRMEKKDIIKSDSSFYYTIRKGDTLTSIAKQFNTTILRISTSNPDTGTSLYAGEKIKIPAADQARENRNPGKKTIISDKNSFPQLEDGFSFPVNKELIKHIAQTSRGITVYFNRQTQVRSINNGIVEYIGKMKGYNNVVIVKYGHDLRAIYGFLNQIAVSGGSIVSNKQIIGDVDRISFLGQVELYFEIRNGTDTKNILQIYPFLNNEEYLVKK